MVKKTNRLHKLLTMTLQDPFSSEVFSALFDGQAGAEKALADLPQTDMSDLCSDWNCYQVIGEVMRASSAVGNCGADPAFLHRVSTRVKHESIDKPAAPSATSAAVAAPAMLAANDHQFRWKLVAGFAGLGMIGAVAWSLSGAFSGAPAVQLAELKDRTERMELAKGATLVIASPQGPVIRDARLEELLSAHKQMGATSLPVPTGFVRNAGFETRRQSSR